MAAIAGVNPFARFENPEILTSIKDVRLNKSFSQVVLEFFTTKDFSKIPNYVFQWIGRCTDLAPELKAIGAFSGNVKNFYSLTKVPSSCVEVANAVNKLYHADKNHRCAAFREMVRKVSDCLNNWFDTFKLALAVTQYTPLRAFVPIVDVLSAGFTAGGSLNNLIDDSVKVHNATTTNEKILHGFAIGMDISYLLVGICGIVSYVISAPVSIVLVPLTTALVCSISHFFFKNIVDPEGKNRNASEVQEALKWKLQPPEVPVVKQIGGLTGAVFVMPTEPDQEVEVSA